MDITNYVLTIWVISFLIVSLDILITMGGDKPSSRLFAIITFITSIWVASQGFFIAFQTVEISEIILRIQYVLGIIISLGFYLFSRMYSDEQGSHFKPFIYLSLVSVPFIYSFLFTDLMIENAYQIGGKGRWAWEVGPLNIIFILGFCALWIVILKNLFIHYRSSKDRMRSNSRNVLVAVSTGIIFPTLFDIVLPYLGYFELNWLGPITSILWVIIIGYSISKYNLFNVQLIAVQIVTVALWVFILTRMILSETLQDLVIHGSMLLVAIVFGTLLIRGIVHEISQREKINKMSEELRSAYVRIEKMADEIQVAHEKLHGKILRAEEDRS